MQKNCADRGSYFFLLALLCLACRPRTPVHASKELPQAHCLMIEQGPANKYQHATHKAKCAEPCMHEREPHSSLLKVTDVLTPLVILRPSCCSSTAASKPCRALYLPRVRTVAPRLRLS